MNKWLLLFVLLLIALLAPASHAQGSAIIGASCSPSGISAISTTGVAVQCQGQPLVWTATGGGSGTGGAAGSLTDATIYVNSSCGVGATNCFAATPGQAFFDCTYTSGLPTVTCSASDTLTASMVGWRIMLTCCGAQGNTNHIGSALQTPAGTTISAINNTTHIITMSANATATEASVLGQAIVMGPPPGSATGADTAFAAASTAALGSGGHCAPMNIGAGIYLVSQGFANTATCKNEITSSATTGWGVTGAGTSGRSGTTIVPVDNFNFSTCTGQASSCFFGVQGAIISNLAIWGGDNSTNVNSSTCGTNAKNILDLNTDSLAYNVLLAGWCANDTALTAIKMDTPGEYCFYCIIDGAGSLGFDATGNSYISHSFAGDALGHVVSAITACGLIVEVGGVVQSIASGYGSCGTGASYSVGVAGTLWEDEDRYLDAASFANPYADITATGIVHSSGLDASSSTPGNTTDGTYTLAAAGAQLFVRDSVIPGGSGFAAIACSVAGVTVVDEGGNTMTGGATNCTNGNYWQSLSTTGTALTTGNVGLTSGWATSSVATAGGDSHAGRFTITGAVGSSGPTLTLTFPKAYYVAPVSCTLTENTTDIASLTSVSAGTPTLTNVLFTFAGTPAAVTYTFDYRCQ